MFFLSPPPPQYLTGYICYDTLICSDGLTVSLIDSLFDVDAIVVVVVVIIIIIPPSNRIYLL